MNKSPLYHKNVTIYSSHFRYFQRYIDCMEPAFSCKEIVQDFWKNYNIYTNEMYNCTLANGTILPKPLEETDSDEDVQNYMSDAHNASSKARCSELNIFLALLLVVHNVWWENVQGENFHNILLT